MHQGKETLHARQTEVTDKRTKRRVTSDPMEYPGGNYTSIFAIAPQRNLWKRQADKTRGDNYEGHNSETKREL